MVLVQPVLTDATASIWDNLTNNNINGLGCNGCPAFRADSCALQTEYLWDSYKVDEGNRMPQWEREGKGPDDACW